MNCFDCGTPLTEETRSAGTVGEERHPLCCACHSERWDGAMAEPPDNETAEQWAWEAFATAHPHEAFAAWPDRFWDFFHAKAPNVTREQLAALMLTTEELPTLNTRPAGR